MAEPNLPGDPAPTPPITNVTANPPAPAPPTTISATPPPAKPPAPAKATAQAPQSPGRRGFLLAILLGLFGSWFAVAWTTLSLSALALALGTFRFMFPNVLSEPPSTFKAGEASNFELDKVDDKFKEIGAWVIRGKDEQNRTIIYALSTVCTHLGCTPNWLEGEKKFKCPCHGSGFKISGVNFEGPAPRPLERFAIRRTDDGQIIVDKSRKFQKELGQWDDPESFLVV